MEQLDSTIVNTAVPAMAESLQVTPLSLKAVVTSYILSLAVCIPVSGWMADRFGTRRVFSIAVASSPSPRSCAAWRMNAPMLVAGRILQGVGAAMMMPVGRLAIVRTFPKVGTAAGDELRHHPGADRAAARAHGRRPDRALAARGATSSSSTCRWDWWRCGWRTATCRITAASATRPLDVVGLVLFGSGAALLSWLLEIFGEHQIDATSAAVLLLLALACWPRMSGMPADRRIRCCGWRCFGCARFASRWWAASSRAWAWAACRFCCRCSTSSAWACPRGSRAC